MSTCALHVWQVPAAVLSSLQTTSLLVQVADNKHAELWNLASTSYKATLLQVADKIGKFPLIIRPAFTLGGTGGGIAYNMDEYQEIVNAGLTASVTKQVGCPQGTQSLHRRGTCCRAPRAGSLVWAPLWWYLQRLQQLCPGAGACTLVGGLEWVSQVRA